MAVLIRDHVGIPIAIAPTEEIAEAIITKMIAAEEEAGSTPLSRSASGLWVDPVQTVSSPEAITKQKVYHVRTDLDGDETTRLLYITWLPLDPPLKHLAVMVGGHAILGRSLEGFDVALENARGFTREERHAKDSTEQPDDVDSDGTGGSDRSDGDS